MAFPDCEYVRLSTVRKNGNPVHTPMWFALAGGKMYMQTNIASWKVKRLRNRPDLEVSPSDSRGNPKGLIWKGSATLHAPGSEVARTSLRALTEHYGWKFRIFNAGLTLFRRKLCYLEITLKEA